ncbi:Retrovirus-related Pol polyprotein from transposon 17.6, partial [Mucuna pruriens]
MYPLDEVKTTFITDKGNFYYRVMPFEIKKCRSHLPKIDGSNDMMAKSSQDEQHCKVLGKIFDVLRKHRLKLNLEKYSFGVQAGKFLGYMLTRRGIKANPNKCAIVINMRSLRSVKEVQ